LRYQPGLDLERSGTRFGATGINIRGIGGNRVGIQLDGIPMRDRFVIGAYSNAGRTLVETDRVKRIEVLHGPASVMYGSDALGGIVAITTWDPADLLMATDNPYRIGIRAGYQGVDDSWAGSAKGAWVTGGHGLLLAATVRDGHELDNNPTSESSPDDPQDWQTRDAMLRYTFDTSGGNRLRLTAEGFERDTETEIFSQLGYGRRFRNTTRLAGDDHDESSRFSVDYEFSGGGWAGGVLRVFHTRYETDQVSHEERAAAPVPVNIDRRFIYQQEHTGFAANLYREALAGSASHRIALGVQALRTDSTELRDGLQTHRETGETTNIILGESMPVRDFPDSRTQELSLFVQDEISWASWEIIPALRWDHYDLDPRPDDIFREDNPDFEAVSVKESRLTPRLGILYHINADWTAYGQYAQGFRAPPFEDANIGFHLPLFGYRAIPNPDLKSETSEGFEFGLRRVSRTASFSLSVFNTDYDDFIESRALIGVDPATGELLFQSRNIESARIKGLDLRYEQRLGQWWTPMENWSFKLAAFWSEGDNRETNQPLNSVSPPQAVFGLLWNSSDGVWDAGINFTVTAAKKSDDIDMTDGPRFATPSWRTIDLTAGWRPKENLEIRAGLFNVTGTRYWRWLDISNLVASDPMIPLLSRPGRNISVSARVEF
jgi:hemoglobin/transferrin/lactoferrin receptor protein